MPDGTETREPYLTVPEAASMMAVGTVTLYRWLGDPKTGIREVAVRLPNGRIRFPAWRLRTWLDGRPKL